MTHDPTEAMAEAMNKRVPLSPTTRRDLAAVALAAYRETDEFKALVAERDRLKEALWSARPVNELGVIEALLLEGGFTMQRRADIETLKRRLVAKIAEIEQALTGDKS